jgi:hypothetical protein
VAIGLIVETDAMVVELATLAEYVCVIQDGMVLIVTTNAMNLAVHALDLLQQNVPIVILAGLLVVMEHVVVRDCTSRTEVVYLQKLVAHLALS